MNRHLGRINALTIVGILLAASLVGAGWWLAQRGDESPAASGPAATTPATVAPTTPSSKPITPPDTKEAVSTAVAFMRREVGMADPVAGPFRWTGTRAGQVDIRARIPGDANPSRGPVTTVSLQRLTRVWYVLGVSTPAFEWSAPGPRIRSPAGYMADIGSQVDDRVRVRVTQDRYGIDIELGGAEVARRQDSPYVDGQVAFRHPTAATGSVVFTRASGHNGEVTSATVVRIRFATVPPPQILAVPANPALQEREGWLVLPDAAVTWKVTATRAERARLVFTASGTEMAWNAQVVAEDRTAGDGLRLTWHPDHGVFGSLGIQVVGPGGVASKDLGQVLSE